MKVPPTYFVQGCPICGRRLKIRLDYLGRQVVCQHCKGTLKATGPSSSPVDGAPPTDDLLSRADALLKTVAQNLQAH